MTKDAKADSVALSEEERRAVAQELYATLNVARRNGTYVTPDGDVIVTPKWGYETEVNSFVPDDPGTQRVLRERGLTDDEMQRGVVNVKSGDSGAGTFKHVVTTNEGQVRFVSGDRGFGRLIQSPSLDSSERSAIRLAAAIMSVPGRIVETFGTFDAFRDSLPDADMQGLVGGDRVGGKLPLFYGGLDVLVSRLQEPEGQRFTQAASVAQQVSSRLA